MKQILIVEDDPDIQELLQNFLVDAGYGVAVAADGVEALTVFSQGAFDLVLLDIMLPKIDGYGVCEMIRQKSGVPIIIITALDGEEHEIKGLDLMADDYVTKPFSMQVLLRRIASVLRRADVPQREGGVIEYKEIRVEIERRHVTVSGRAVDVTRREFDILCELLTNQGCVLSRQLLLSQLWQYDFYGDDRVVDTHIKNLRKKLGVNYIETVRGVGYRIDKEN